MDQRGPAHCCHSSFVCLRQEMGHNLYYRPCPTAHMARFIPLYPSTFTLPGTLPHCVHSLPVVPLFASLGMRCGGGWAWGHMVDHLLWSPGGRVGRREEGSQVGSLLRAGSRIPGKAYENNKVTLDSIKKVLDEVRRETGKGLWWFQAGGGWCGGCMRCARDFGSCVPSKMPSCFPLPMSPDCPEPTRIGRKTPVSTQR